MSLSARLYGQNAESDLCPDLAASFGGALAQPPLDRTEAREVKRLGGRT
jgi:hypothetical protein